MNGWKYDGLYVHIWVSVSFITGHKSTLVSKFQISKFTFHEVRLKIKATGKKKKKRKNHGREHESTRKNGIREKVQSEQYDEKKKAGMFTEMKCVYL